MNCRNKHARQRKRNRQTIKTESVWGVSDNPRALSFPGGGVLRLLLPNEATSSPEYISQCSARHLILLILLTSPITWYREKKKKKQTLNIYWNKETKNNKCLISLGYHNSGKPITVVPKFKKICKKQKTVKLHMTIKNNNKDGQTHYVKP